MNGAFPSILTAVVTAQKDPGVNVDVGIGQGLVGGAIGAFLTTLVVGAILIAVVPSYTERMMTVVLDDPVGSFGYGIVCLLFIALVSIVLVITLIDIFLAIPLLVAAYLLWAVGAAIAYLALGERLAGREDGWPKPLLVGAGINGAFALTGIGGILAIGIGAAGFGAVLRSLLR